MTSTLIKLEKTEDFSSFLQASNKKLLLVKFSTTWCIPCQRLSEVIKELQREKEIVVLEVDAEKFAHLAQEPRFNIQAVPSSFLFYQGKVVKKSQGYMNLEELKKFVEI